MNGGALRLRLEILLWRHGWVWPLVLVLGLAAAALGYQAQRLQAQAEQLQASLRALPAMRGRTAGAPTGPQAGLLPPELAAAPDVPASVARMLALAQAAGLEVTQAEYLHGDIPELQLARTQVVQPVRASYPQLRRYLEAVLQELPHASLDQVAARRDTVAHGQLEVRLQWSLWRAAPGSAR